jgi:hypothetical protein
LAARFKLGTATEETVFTVTLCQAKTLQRSAAGALPTLTELHPQHFES